jgi:uncharacterized protein
MAKFTGSDKIYIDRSRIPNSGRGVFARVDIRKGEIIERCPVIEIPPGDTANLTDSIIITYVYHLGKNKTHTLFPLGFGALYNHTYTPNAEYQGVLKEGFINFIAIEDIGKDEEITVNYNPEKSAIKNPLWFE